MMNFFKAVVKMSFCFHERLKSLFIKIVLPLPFYILSNFFKNHFEPFFNRNFTIKQLFILIFLSLIHVSIILDTKFIFHISDVLLSVVLVVNPINKDEINSGSETLS